MQTDTARKLPGDLDIWVFVLGDMLIFSAYFFAYLLDRSHDVTLFTQSQLALNQHLGIVNTLVLLTSSLMVALCVHAARAGERADAVRFLDLGVGCGLGFLVLKASEWYAKLSSGITLGSNAFYMHYFVLTGVHVLHVLIGLAFLLILRLELRTSKSPRVQLLEAGGTYWHMVDFLWLLIFALLYLMR
jgi:nitric oxide reductase NorE protein